MHSGWTLYLNSSAFFQRKEGFLPEMSRVKSGLVTLNKLFSLLN